MPTLDWLNRDAAFKVVADVKYRLLEHVSTHVANNALAPDATAFGPQRPAGSALSRKNSHSREDLFSALEAPPDSRSSQKADGSQNMDDASDAGARVTPPASTATHDNLLIQGDNLEALKALLPFYRGQVKCIFIDPPYNTKSAFEHYDDNLEHAQWLSMMLPRLQLLRELLREDGSIWVTIDDNEGHYLKVLMDEVFGRGRPEQRNFVANIVWRSADSSNNDAKQFSLDHNHILVYSKTPGWLSTPLERDEAANSHYKNPDNDPRGPWFAGNLSSPKPRENLRYSITSPTGVEISPPANGWRWSRETMDELISLREVVFTKDGTRVMKKTYLADQRGLSPSTVWDDIEETGHNRQAKYELKRLFPEVVTAELFGTPKPERVVMQALKICTSPNDLVLDSFLGSGTTAAVAQKMGRRWIGIEMGEHAKTHCLPRLQKVLDGEQGGISKAVHWQGGGSFRFMQLGAPVFDETGAIHPNVRFATLAAFVWMQETGVPWHKKKGSSPFLGTHNGVDYFLLFNGILGDKRPNAGNVLTRAVLLALTTEFPSNGRPRVIYGESNRLGEERLKEALVQFKSIPHEVVKR